MGAATLDLTTLDLSRTIDISLALQDPTRLDISLGEIILTATLYPKTQEDKEQVRLSYTFYVMRLFLFQGGLFWDRQALHLSGNKLDEVDMNTSGIYKYLTA